MNSEIPGDALAELDVLSEKTQSKGIFIDFNVGKILFFSHWNLMATLCCTPQSTGQCREWEIGQYGNITLYDLSSRALIHAWLFRVKCKCIKHIEWNPHEIFVHKKIMIFLRSQSYLKCNSSTPLQSLIWIRNGLHPQEHCGTFARMCWIHSSPQAITWFRLKIFFHSLSFSPLVVWNLFLPCVSLTPLCGTSSSPVFLSPCLWNLSLPCLSLTLCLDPLPTLYLSHPVCGTSPSPVFPSFCVCNLSFPCLSLTLYVEPLPPLSLSEHYYFIYFFKFTAHSNSFNWNK